MKDLLALVIDYGTTAAVGRINREIGTAMQYERTLKPSTDGHVYFEYEDLLRQYVFLKLKLHRLRRTLYYSYDTCAEKEQLDHILDECEHLRSLIKEKRAEAGLQVWGDLTPVTQMCIICNEPAPYVAKGGSYCFKHLISISLVDSDATVQCSYPNCFKRGERWLIDGDEQNIAFCHKHWKWQIVSLRRGAKRREFLSGPIQARVRSHRKNSYFADAVEPSDIVRSVTHPCTDTACPRALEGRHQHIMDGVSFF